MRADYDCLSVGQVLLGLFGLQSKLGSCFEVVTGFVAVPCVVLQGSCLSEGPVQTRVSSASANMVVEPNVPGKSSAIAANRCFLTVRAWEGEHRKCALQVGFQGVEVCAGEVQLLAQLLQAVVNGIEGGNAADDVTAWCCIRQALNELHQCMQL